jgi:hypothetical protein
MKREIGKSLAGIAAYLNPELRVPLLLSSYNVVVI